MIFRSLLLNHRFKAYFSNFFAAMPNLLGKPKEHGLQLWSSGIVPRYIVLCFEVTMGLYIVTFQRKYVVCVHCRVYVVLN
jgi:hypothetical protein